MDAEELAQGASLLRFQDLFRVKPEDLTQQAQTAYVAQSALLVEYLKQTMPESAILAAAGEADPAATLARAMGMSTKQLAAAWERAHEGCCRAASFKEPGVSGHDAQSRVSGP